MEKERYFEVYCTYNNGEGFWCVDAYFSEDPDEYGKVIAVIHEKSGDVYYIDALARTSKLAQEVIKAKVAEIKGESSVSAEGDAVVVGLSNGNEVELKECWEITDDDSYSVIEVYDHNTKELLGSLIGELPDITDEDFDMGEYAEKLENRLEEEGII
jgi:hypothetical protein